jgi:hypothetical protein
MWRTWSSWSVVLASLLLCQTPAWARSAEEVAHELANPNTSLGFFALPIDYIRYDGDLDGADDEDGWRVSFQPSLPYPSSRIPRTLPAPASATFSRTWRGACARRLVGAPGHGEVRGAALGRREGARRVAVGTG